MEAHSPVLETMEWPVGVAEEHVARSGPRTVANVVEIVGDPPRDPAGRKHDPTCQVVDIGGDDRVIDPVANPSGAAFVATCARIRWTVIDAMTLRIDDGFDFDLRVDPTVVVEKQVNMSVERWRGAIMEPLWSLLKSKKE